MCDRSARNDNERVVTKRKSDRKKCRTMSEKGRIVALRWRGGTKSDGEAKTVIRAIRRMLKSHGAKGLRMEHGLCELVEGSLIADLDTGKPGKRFSRGLLRRVAPLLESTIASPGFFTTHTAHE